jgi:hypothetical protein
LRFIYFKFCKTDYSLITARLRGAVLLHVWHLPVRQYAVGPIGGATGVHVYNTFQTRNCHKRSDTAMQRSRHDFKINLTSRSGLQNEIGITSLYDKIEKQLSRSMDMSRWTRIM